MIKTAHQIYYRLIEKLDVCNLEYLEFRNWFIENKIQGKEVKIIDMNKPLTLSNVEFVDTVEGMTPRIFSDAKHISKKKNRKGWVVDIQYKGRRYHKYAASYEVAVRELNKMIIENHLPHKLQEVE